MKKETARRMKYVLIVLLLLFLGIGLWLADYFLIPKAERTDVKAPVSSDASPGDIPEKESVSSAAEEEIMAAEEPPEEMLPEESMFPVLLDAFPEEAANQPVEAGTGSVDDPEGTSVVGASDDGRNRIVVTKTVTGTGDDRITYYVADLLLADIRELKTCFAKDSYGENIYERTSSMAKRCQAVLAVNGDCYGWRDNGIVIRNGELFRDIPVRVGFALYEDGHMGCYEETSATGQELLDQGVWSAYSFGPELVHDGRAAEGLEAEYKVDPLSSSIEHKQPRTAIGQIGPNHFVLVVADGRQPGYSRGMRMWELADLMESLGCREAYNLDGGSSATMYFKGEVVNHSCSKKGEREVSDCIFVN